MNIYIINKSNEQKVIEGHTVEPNESFEIQSIDRIKIARSTQVIEMIQSGEVEISVDGVNPVSTDPETELGILTRGLFDDFPSSCAIDKDGVNQNISSTDWEKIEGYRILWDFTANWNELTHVFTVPVDGVYDFDIQLRITNCVASSVEIALFKVEEPEDDYWFILDRCDNVPVSGVVQLNGATQFDFRKDEQYYVAIKLEGMFPSCVISGDDDYTAWGFNRSGPLIGG